MVQKILEVNLARGILMTPSVQIPRAFVGQVGPRPRKMEPDKVKEMKHAIRS